MGCLGRRTHIVQLEHSDRKDAAIFVKIEAASWLTARNRRVSSGTAGSDDMVNTDFGYSALVLVDIQNDFCPGGSLPIHEGDRIVPIANRYIKLFQSAHMPVYATRDWHPVETSHFHSGGGTWPPHCVQNSVGALLHPDLSLPKDAVVVSKGTGPSDDAYSGFDAREGNGTPLAVSLRGRAIRRIYVAGLATDYCVKATVLDALAQGFEATLLVDAVRGVNVRTHDSEEAITEMVRAGASMSTLERLEQALARLKGSEF
jgi:nicotinamidase/pyrazinamidase